MSGEFEDRERHELGELPQDLGRSLGGAVRTSEAAPQPAGNLLAPRPGRTPIDIAQQGAALNAGEDNSKLGSPVIPASVTSVYDARPINARDWVNLQQIAVASAEAENNFTATFTIPEGYTGVWRRFRWQPIQPIYVPFDETFPTVSLFLDGIAIPNYFNLFYGATMTGYEDVFAIGSAGQIFSMVLTVPSNIITGPIGTDFSFKLEMYGQLLLTRGLPPPFEISTQVKSGTNVREK